MLIISLLIVIILTAADQIIKYVVVNNIDFDQVIHVIKIGSHEILNLTHIRNSGAAWSIMEGRTWFLIGFPSLVIIAAVAYLFVRRKKLTKLEMISLSMVLAGGIGNLIDRIRMKEVIDYISVKFINFPIFNFADICVVLGMIMFCVYIVIFDEADKKKPEEIKAPQAEDMSDD